MAVPPHQAHKRAVELLAELYDNYILDYGKGLAMITGTKEC